LELTRKHEQYDHDQWLLPQQNRNDDTITPPAAETTTDYATTKKSSRRRSHCSKPLPRFSSTPFILNLLAIMIILQYTPTIVNAQQQQNLMTMNGGSLLAMSGHNCVALAVDKRFGSGSQMVTIAPRHVWSPHPNVMLGFVGLEGDVRTLKDELKVQVSSKRNRSLGFVTADTDVAHQRRITPPALAYLVSHVLFNKRGYFVEPIVAGLMPNTYKPFLCAMDMIGAQSFSRSFVCAGAASLSLYGTAEALWKPNMEPQELAEICGKAFQSALERDCLSGYGVLVYLITKDGIVEYDLASRND
jgi:20S proteasome subunit beta 3